MDNFDLVTSIIIARDAETDHTAAFSSVTAALKNNGLSVPDILFYGFNQKWQPPQQGIAIF